ncbi:MAG TPA: hypothetical protein VFO24_12680, partial [Usitatibacter sp.]|nr:hypothetical protein [Usitatibacter sp.]
CRDGRLISVTALGTAHFSELAEVEAMQYEQSVPGELVLKVVAPAPLGARAERGIAQAIEARTEGGCRVAIARVDRIERTPRGKARMLVQRLDLRSSLEECLGDRR